MARLGEPGAAGRAAEVIDAMVLRLWHEEDGIFHPIGPEGRLRVSTWAGLAPLILAGLPPRITARLVDEHVLREGRYRLPFPVPSVSAEEASFRPRDTGWPIRRYWRGPSWLFSTRFVLDGLLRDGRVVEARDLAGRTADLVLREGFREYYDPTTGAGMGGRAFSVSAIALDCALRAEGFVTD